MAHMDNRTWMFFARFGVLGSQSTLPGPHYRIRGTDGIPEMASMCVCLLVLVGGGGWEWEDLVIRV
jgi:hypothetical protein